MSDPKQLAKAAREQLAQALSALQSASDLPEDLEDTTDLIAEAMSLFHRIERGSSLDGRSEAFRKVRRALDRFLDWPLPHAVMPVLVEATAAALAKAYGLAKWSGEQSVRAELTPPPPAIAPAPIAPAPVVAVIAPVMPAPVAVIPEPRPIAPVPVVVPEPRPIAPAPVVVPEPRPIAPAPVVVPEPKPIAPAPVAPTPAPVAPLPKLITPAPVLPAPTPVAPAPVAPSVPMPIAPKPTPAPAEPVVPKPIAAAPPAEPVLPPIVPRALPKEEPPPAPIQPEPPKKTEALPAPPPGTPVMDVELSVTSSSNFYRGLLGDDVVENGGIFVATYKTPKIGAPLVLRVQLPGGFSFEAHVSVHWTRAMGSSLDSADPGFGARITRITQEGRSLIERYTRNREPIFYDEL